MKAYIYTGSDRTGDGPQSIIVFAESEQEADNKAREFYDEKTFARYKEDGGAPVEIVAGNVIVAHSYYQAVVEASDENAT